MKDKNIFDPKKIGRVVDKYFGILWEELLRAYEAKSKFMINPDTKKYFFEDCAPSKSNDYLCIII